MWTVHLICVQRKNAVFDAAEDPVVQRLWNYIQLYARVLSSLIDNNKINSCCDIFLSTVAISGVVK